MQAKYKETAPEMEWKVMDVMDMQDFPDASFDVAIDKGRSLHKPQLEACWVAELLLFCCSIQQRQERWMLSWYGSRICRS